MEKNLFKLAGLVISAMLLGACSQMATFENEDLVLQQEAAVKSGFNLTPYGAGGNENAAILSGGGNCVDNCINATSGSIYAATGSSPTVQWGGQNQVNESKTLSVKVWNTLTTIEYELKIVTTANQAGNLQYYDEATLSWINIGALTNNVVKTISRPLSQGWKACDVITEQWREVGGGAPAILGDVSYSLIGECPDCDTESFSYLATNENLNVVFSYDAASALTNAVVEFTFPQIMGMTLNLDGKYTAPDGKMYSVNNPTNQTVFTWVGNIGCTDATAATFTFAFSPDCGAGNANDGQARIWSDTKVNGVSVKNSGTPNIDYEGCPVNP